MLNKKTIGIVVLFALLLATYLVLEREPVNEGTRDLVLPRLSDAGKSGTDAAKKVAGLKAAAQGPAAQGSAAPAKAGAPAKTAPAAASEGDPMGAINRVEIARAGERLVLDRRGDEIWEMSRDLAGSTAANSAGKRGAVRADTYKVTAMLRLFTSRNESVFSTPAQGQEDLRYYGLDDESRLQVTLHRDGAVWLALVIGTAQKSDDESQEKDTFVQRIEDVEGGGEPEAWIYRIQGRDLRAPFDKSYDELRSKKLFAFDKKDVVELQLARREPGLDANMVLRRREGATEGQDVTWTMVKPAGYRAAAPTSYLSTLANLSVSGFAASAPAQARLEKPRLRVTLVLADGSKRSLAIGEEVDGDVWVRNTTGHEAIAGASAGEVARISKYTGKSLMKGAFDFREKKILAEYTKAGQLISLDLGELSMTSDGDHWRVTSPKAFVAGRDEVAKFLKALDGFAVDSFLAEVPALAESGLASGAHRALFQAKGRSLELLMGAEKDGKVYGTVNGSGEVFLATKYNADKLHVDPETLRRHRIFELEAGKVASLVVTHPDGSFSLARKGKAWALDDASAKGKTPSAALDQREVESIATTLASLRAKDFVAPSEVPGAAFDPKTVSSIRWTADSEGYRGQDNKPVADSRTLWLSSMKKDGNSYARCDDPVWGAQVFTLQPFQVNKVKKKLHELTN